MASNLTPLKRPSERNALEPNVRGKWQKTTHVGTQQSQLKIQPGVTVFRILCPASKSGSVIGKGGGVIATIRQETGVKIKLEETVPGCDERVIVITTSEKDAEVTSLKDAEVASEKDAEVLSEKDKENDAGNEQGKENHAGNKQDKENDEGAGGSAESDNEKESLETKEEAEDSSAATNSKSEKATPSALKALLLIFERIFVSKEENDAGDESGENPSSVCLRLLVLSCQVGCLLGKGGSVIKQMSADSGSQIRILPRDKLPICASSHDELLQITGGIDSIRKALHSVAQQLLENPPRERDVVHAANPSGSSSHPFASVIRSEGLPPGPPPNYHLPNQGPPFSSRPFDIADHRPNIGPPFPSFPEALMHGHPPVPPELLTFRLLCSNDKVGSVIGKGGNIIKNLQHDTGCEIKILETIPESDDRIITISGPAHPSDRISPAQNAILLVQHRIVLAASDKDSPLTCRLLVSPNQTGCLLGKGGGIIAEMRKLSGAHIRVLSKDQIPKGVPENDEVVQINGDFEATQEALMQITARLRHHLFRDRIPGMNPNFRPPFGALEPPFGPYMGRHDSPPPRLYPNMPPFQKDFIGRPLDERSAFAHGIHGSAVPLGADRVGPWGPKGMRDIGGPMSIPEFPGGLQRRIGGFSGPGQPAVVPNITVDVIIPRSVIPSLYGEDGGCLRRIREFSEAKITITEPRPESTDTVILVSGTPDQMHAAQSLLQAFALSESMAS